MSRIFFILLVSLALSACRDGGSSDKPKAAQTQQTTSYSQPQAPQPDETPKRQLANTTEQTPADPAAGAEQASVDSGGLSEERVEIQPSEPAQAVEPAIVTLEWTIPLQRENGELLGANDLDGYIIEYSTAGKTSGFEEEYVVNGQTSRYELTLLPGSYQFRVIAVDITGLKSEPSEWVTADLI